jgi:hypothetical protein
MKRIAEAVESETPMVTTIVTKWAWTTISTMTDRFTHLSKLQPFRNTHIHCG